MSSTTIGNTFSNPPLHKPVTNTANRLVKCHPTPLHNLMHTYNIKPQLIETVKMV
jgi:hypothetical protein